jgi:hypothetical protein
MCLLNFSKAFVSSISKSKKTPARYHKWTHVFMYRTRYSCYILIKLLNFLNRFSKKILNDQVS